MHFPESSFMNYTRSKLNKTTAIPTIFINEHNEEVDLLSSPTDWVIANSKASIPTQFQESNVTTIDMDDSTEYEAPPAKKIGIEATPKAEVRILNKMMTSPSNKILTVKQKPTPKVVPYKPSPILPTSTAAKIHKIPIKQEITLKRQRIEQQKTTPTSSAQISQNISLNDSDPQETYEFLTVIPANDQQSFTSENAVSQMSSEEIKSLFAQTSQELSEIKSILRTKGAPVQTPAKPEASNITQSQLNKVQLFNGIKRYLSPSLIALLRMELFGGPNREYKKDEKIICTELLKLGDETFDFLNDEWRLRLPSKDEVKSWQHEEITDDDAC